VRCDAVAACFAQVASFPEPQAMQYSRSKSTCASEAASPPHTLVELLYDDNFGHNNLHHG
jgi:hypothetical protein